MKNEIKAKFCKGNIKLGNMLTFSKLMSADTFETKYGKVKGSCGKYCGACAESCYVKKSYRYPSVIDSHARNTEAVRQNIYKAFNDLDDQLTRKRNKAEIVRIHQSGEIERPLELLMWVRMAHNHPETLFYTYTKNIDAVRLLVRQIKQGVWNECDFKNFTINISVWHEYLLKEFLEEFADYNFIKAFVYDDRAFDYNAHGLKIETYCTAYDEHGKMNHAITCDKCRKCIKSNYKVIGCFDH